MAQNRIGRAALFALAITVCLSLPVFAQFGPLTSRAQAPQAKSQQELDEYLLVVSEPSSSKIVGDVDLFALHFPNSELLGTAYQYQMHAYKEMNNFSAMLAAGQHALQFQPNNLNTLTVLAPAIANRMLQVPSDKQLPDLAETYSRTILNSLDKTKPPRQIPLQQWLIQKRSMQSGAHEVLGLVAIARQKPDVAISEFQQAIQSAPVADGTLYLRLGIAYVDFGNTIEARKNFQQAIEYGPEAARQLALEQIGKLEKKEK